MIHRGLRRRPFDRLGRFPAIAYLAARTRFYDEVVRSGWNEGITNVVIIAAGYDSRAWRLARPGASFYEVDHPATQADKRARAPSGGPTWVPVDLSSNSVREALRDAGLAAGARVLFTVEGLTMYFSEDVVEDLLTQLAELGGPGSRLAIDFGYSATERATLLARTLASTTRAVAGLTREPLRFTLAPADAALLLGRSGWTVSEIVTGPGLKDRCLKGTGLATPRLDSAFVATATRI